MHNASGHGFSIAGQLPVASRLTVTSFEDVAVAFDAKANDVAMRAAQATGNARHELDGAAAAWRDAALFMRAVALVTARPIDAFEERTNEALGVYWTRLNAHLHDAGAADASYREASDAWTRRTDTRDAAKIIVSRRGVPMREPK